MSERKVLNKYYPPDFDPSKLPKLKRERNRQFVIRIMAPFTMKCLTCGEYIYKGRKFNSRMETVENETYLGLRIYRLYIRCTKCITEICFKTDPENTDYKMEAGAERTFESFRVLQERLEKEKLEQEEDEANNPMKALENRTRDSKREMESVEKLEELRDMNQRLASMKPDQLLEGLMEKRAKAEKKQEMQDEELVRSMFGGGSVKSSGGIVVGADGYVKRIVDEESSDEDDSSKRRSSGAGHKRSATDFLLAEDVPGPSQPKPKAKLKLRQETDIAGMIKPKSNISAAKREQVQAAPGIDGEGSKPETTPKAVPTAVDIVVPPSGTSIEEKSVEKESEAKVKDALAPLPAFKIVLKKNTVSKTKMKGNSLSMLGGYDDSSSSDDGI